MATLTDRIGGPTRLGVEPVARVAGAALIALAIALFTAGTWWGIGLRPDTMLYFDVGPDALRQAPLYQWLISFGAAAGFEPRTAALGINLLLYAGSFGLMFVILREAGVTFLLSLLGVAVVLLAPQVNVVFFTALSEPAFIACLLGFFFAMSRFLSGGGYAFMAIAAVFAGGCVLARFAGAPAVAAGCLALLLFRPVPVLTRFIESFLFGAIASALFLSWYVTDQLAGGRGIGREAGIHGFPAAQDWYDTFTTFSVLLAPGAIPPILRAVILAVFALATLYLTWRVVRPTRPGENEAPAVARVAMLFAWIYFGFVILAMFIEANLSVAARVAMPILVCVVIATFAVFGRQAAPADLRFAKPLVIAAAIVFGLFGVLRSGAQAVKHVSDGIYFASPVWYASPTLAHVRNLPDEIHVYSNGPDPVILILGRRAEFWPRLFNFRTGKVDPHFPPEEDLARLTADVAAGRAVVVTFDAIDWRRSYMMSEAEVVERAGLEVLFEADDGRVYGLPSVLENAATAE